MANFPSVSGVLSRLVQPLSLLAALVSGLVLPAAAQVSYTGNTATENFGTVAIGSPKTVALSFSVVAGTTVGSIGVLTQGSPNLDFTDATSSTCTATAYPANTNCTLNVTFTPQAAGLRTGAVVFFIDFDRTGGQLVNVPVYGYGTGPQIAFGPAVATAIAPTVAGLGLNTPEGVALDGAGDLFIADYENSRILEVPASGGAATAVDPATGSDIDSPYGLAVDGAGDLFIAGTNDYNLEELPAGGGPAIVIYAEIYVTGVTVDGAGDLFFVEPYTGVVELPAGGGAAIDITPTVNDLELHYPYGVAVDSAGDLYIADTSNNRVVEVPAGGAAAVAIDPTVNGKALSVPYAVAVDGLGALFIADTGNSRIVEVPAGGGTPIAIAPTVNGVSLGYPYGVAVDGGGDLFISDPNNGRVVKVERSQPPTVNFPTITPVGETDTTDGTETVQVFNIGTQALDFTALSYPVDFPEVSGDANACTSSTSLSTGQECDLPIEFAPQSFGPKLSEDVTLTSNALNGSGAQQSIAVNGTTPPPDTLYTPVAGSVLNGPAATFIWSPASGATGYSLWIGTTGAGSNNVYDSGETTANSIKVGVLPTNGGTINVRLYTTSGKTTVHSDYTFTAATQAVMTSPAAGSVLGGSTVTFTWSASVGGSGYSLWLGSTGAGSDNLYSSHETTGTSATAKGLPTNGETIYARLYTNFNGIARYQDYTYKAE